MGLFLWSRAQDENAQRPTYEPHGLASDELFAIPAHPHGAGLCQSSGLARRFRASGRAGGLEPPAISTVDDVRTGTTHRAGSCRTHVLPPALASGQRGLRANLANGDLQLGTGLWKDLPTVLS